jgi:hypothetical protein
MYMRVKLTGEDSLKTLYTLTPNSKAHTPRFKSTPGLKWQPQPLYL